jgi:RHS repeat-associated protein
LTRLADGQVWHYVTDHLGTPQEMYDQDGEIVWAADFSAYGLTARSLAQEVDNPIRFPGQYHDQETGLHYNRFRYYDPQVGRYISQDPIGLKGGANLYSYVHGNPVLRIDPLGLDDTMCMYNPSMCGMAPVPSESNVSVGLGAWGNLLGSYGSGEVGADVDSTGTMCIHVQSCVGAIVGLPLQGQIGITAGTGTGTLCTGTQTTYGGFVVGGAGVGGGGQVTGNSGGMALSRGMVGVGASPEGVVAGAGGLMCRTRYWCTK